MLARVFQWMLVVYLVGGIASAAAEDPMVGDWKLNPAKSKLTDEMKVADLGGNKYSFDLGGGDPEIAVADGTDQPGHFGTTIAVIVGGPDKWTFVRKKGGKMQVTGVWTLSEDGSTLTDHYTSVRPSGETATSDYVYDRRGGGQGFAGNWVSRSTQVNSALVIKVQAWEGDGLSFITPGAAGTKNVKFDGKDYSNVGASVDGLTAAARRTNERTLELTDKLSGKVIDTQDVKVSDDGKTMTMTIHIPRRSEPNVQVFDKQ